MASESKIEVIEIGRNRLESKGAKALAKVLAAKKSFTKVNVQQNGIKKDGTIELLKSIRDNPGIEELFLNDNWVKGEEAVTLLDDIARICTKLRVVNLSDNNIGDAASEKIFEILNKHGSSLERLFYNYNELSTETTIRKCLDIALKLPKLKGLEMEGNSISKKIAEEYQTEFEKKGIECKLRGEDEEEEEAEGSDNDD